MTDIRALVDAARDAVREEEQVRQVYGPGSFGQNRAGHPMLDAMRKRTAAEEAIRRAVWERDQMIGTLEKRVLVLSDAVGRLTADNGTGVLDPRTRMIEVTVKVDRAVVAEIGVDVLEQTFRNIQKDVERQMKEGKQ